MFQIARFNTVKMAILLKLSYRFNASPINIPANFLAETDKLILKCIWEFKGPRMVKTISKKKNKVGRLTLPDLKTYYKATEIKTV